MVDEKGDFVTQDETGELPPVDEVEGRAHGRQRWRQGYELKEVVRELTLLRITLVEFLDRYRGALPARAPEDLTRSFHRINIFMDDEIYKTVEAYLDASHNPQAN